MKLPLNWIKKYTQIDISPEEYMEKMIMTGTAVEGIEELAGDINNVVVGKVLSVKNHENSDHLHVCIVDVGQEEPLQIVCGAPNVKENILVPVALVGASLPGDFKIKKGKLRGVESFGMICSGPEINVPTYLYPSVGDDGILIFNEDYPLGMDVKKVFGLDDIVIDYEILANRPDCLSVLGIARESAAVLGTNYNEPKPVVKQIGENINDYIKVDVLDKSACPRFCARAVKNIRIGQSPAWLRQYLFGAGIRSINNIVDITNFVMLETGHPMHAYDQDKINGKHIIVRRAKANEYIKTLDENEYHLHDTDLVICDENGVTGLAGIMGGAESEITENTKNIIFECAVFDKAVTRIAARNLGIRTEASGRFEKGVNVADVKYAIDRACQLVNELDAGDVISGTVDVYDSLPERQTIEASVKSICNRAGVDIPAKDIVRILEKLHFNVALSNDTIVAKVPTFRVDLDGEADLCEEALRIYGFNHIPCTRLRGTTTQGCLSPKMKFNNQASEALRAMGFMEMVRYSFIGEKLLNKLNLPEDDKRRNFIKLLNPLGEDTAIMRTTLVPDMLQTLSLNMNRGNANVKLYEISTKFLPDQKTAEGLPLEENSLCLGSYGTSEDFYSLRSSCEALFDSFGLKPEIRIASECYYHTGRCAEMLINNDVVAVLGEIHPDVMKNFELSKRTYVAEINMAKLMKYEIPMGEIAELPKYPSITRDLAMIFPETTQIGSVLEEAKAAGGKYLESANMFDVYRGISIPAGSKSVAFSFVFRSSERTLKDKDVQKATNNIINTISEKFDANIRE